MHGTRIFALLVVFFLASPGAVAASDRYWVGLASFSGMDQAKGYIRSVAGVLNVPLTITRVATEAGEFFRVMGGPFTEIGAARAAVAAAKEEAIDTAWLVVEPSR